MLLAWGILLAGGAGALTGWLVIDNPTGGPKYTPQLLGQALPMTPRMTPLAVFCSGLALGVIFCVGVWLIATAGRRRHLRRTARRQAAPAAAPTRAAASPPPAAAPIRSPAPPPPTARPIRSAPAQRPAAPPPRLVRVEVATSSRAERRVAEAAATIRGREHADKRLTR